MQKSYKSLLAELEECGKLQKYRIKRNIALYDPTDTITRAEAMRFMKTIKEYWGKAKMRFQNYSPQLVLFELD